MYSYDDQLIDAVRVRRLRLAHALLHREERLRRQWDERVGTFVISVFLAALACAACVAVSFVIHLLANDTTIQRGPRPGVGIEQPASGSPAAHHRGAGVDR